MQETEINKYKMAFFWVVAPRWAKALMLEAVSISATLINFYQSTRSNKPKHSRPSSHLPPRDPEVLKTNIRMVRENRSHGVNLEETDF
jgi:hypothetical protein